MTNLDGVRVTVISNDPITDRMAGPAIRALNLAQQMSARGASVTLAGPAVFGRYEFAVRSFGFANPTNFRALAISSSARRRAFSASALARKY